MKYCPKCKTTGLPDEAKFCPNCGASLTPEESTKRMTISECRLVPNIIKKGERCKLEWKGNNVDSITIDERVYYPNDEIVLYPNQSYIYNIRFSGKDGKQIVDKVGVTVKQPRTSVVQDNQEIKFLYGDKGKISSVKGRLLVDIRQCKRTSGLGWDGEYEFQGRMPVGYDGFYAMFDESESIQILVEKGELNTVFIVWRDYTLKFWRGEKREAYKKDIGIIFSDYVTQYRYEKVIFGAMYYNGELLHSLKNHEVGKENLGLLFDRLTDTYHKEVYNFFGISIEQLLENVEDYAEYEEEYDKD